MSTRTRLRRGIAVSVLRDDAVPKTTGQFAYSSDLHADGMLHGATVRCPHPHARIRSIDTSAALLTEGVRCVLTHEDVPGRKTYGMEEADQPVLAWDRVRYSGEAVALVAADDADTARLAASRVVVVYEQLEPVTDPEAAIVPTSPAIHEGGNIVRFVRIRHGEQGLEAPVVVRGVYEVGMQDQAFLGPESGIAIPDAEGGVDLHVATQWLHVDRDQISESLGLRPEKVRIHLAGVGGAFGGREDVSMQIHACLLALRTNRPVRMVYSREESFIGHVHRHPARMEYEHGADESGKLVYVRARVVLDGGAYRSSSNAVISNAATFACGPYEVPAATVDAVCAFTNNPPCGAMRGFGAVQVAVAHEAQMDRLAEAIGLDPVEVRLRNAMKTGSHLITGQIVDGPAPIAELLERLGAMSLPQARSAERDFRYLPGGVANVTHGEGVRRGVGFAIGVKNIGFSEGFDDYSTARVRVAQHAGEPYVEVHTAAAEVGQGLVTVLAQIARTELGIDDVRVLPADTFIGSSGSTSASRQTWMTGGAVKVACEAVRVALTDRAALLLNEHPSALGYDDGIVRGPGSGTVGVVEIVLEGAVEETREFHHRTTYPLDPETGQGDSCVAFAFAAHRAVVDVDVETGLVRVVEIATTQDVGRIMNPIQCEGQIHGGIAQGLGLALMEELIVQDGRIRNASFTDYLLPTILDMPPIRLELLEHPHPDAPYGLTGVGEPPNIASTPAVAAAVRQATGRDLTRVPIRPEHIVGV